MVDIQSATAEITRGKKIELECGPMLNMMATLLNIGGALCSMSQSLADARYTRVACSNAVKTRKPLKFAGVPQTPEWILAVSGPSSPYCEDMWRICCCLTSFFRLLIHALVAKI